MRLQRMLGHLPALVHPKPRSVLVVGCGAGVTAGSFVSHPEVERIVICEIEPLIPQVVATLLRQRELQRRRRSARRGRLRRRPALHPHHPREVRHHHLRPDPPLGQGRGDALHAGVFRAVQAAPEPRRRGHPVGAALREQRRTWSRARSPPSSRPSRTARSGATTSTARATTSSCSAGRSPRGSTSTRSSSGWTARLPARGGVAARVEFDPAHRAAGDLRRAGPDLKAWLRAPRSTGPQPAAAVPGRHGPQLHQGEPSTTNLAYRRFPDDLFTGSPAEKLKLPRRHRKSEIGLHDPFC